MQRRIFLIVFLFLATSCIEMPQPKKKEANQAPEETSDVIESSDQEKSTNINSTTNAFGNFLENNCVKGNVEHCYSTELSKLKTVIQM